MAPKGATPAKEVNMVTFEIQKGYFTVWDGKTKYDFYMDQSRNFDDLFEPEYLYQYAKKRNLGPGETIDLMLKYLHVRRIIKVDYLADLSLVVGFIGPRGSGKSVGACAYAVIDYLLAGKSVWSNMFIEIKVKYRDCEKIFRSLPLDKAALMDINDFERQYADGLIVIDELNIEIGDAKRSMSNQMLWFDFMLQEVRKRRMNICYQLQAEEWAGSRSRWQTDLYIVCQDYAFLNRKPTKENIGRWSRWRIHDMSGIITGEIKYSDGYHRKVEYFNQIRFWNTPFWGVYDTTQMQSYKKFDPSKIDKGDNGKGLTIDEKTLKRLTAGYSVLPELLVKLLNVGNRRILRDDLWDILQVDNQAEKTRIGELLHSLGCEDFRNDKKRGYVLPDRETLVNKLTELGVEVEIAS